MTLIEQIYRIPSDYAEAVELNRVIRQKLESENIEEHVCNAVEICVIEALNNVVKHAYQGDNTKWIDVSLNLNSKVLEIRITDEGKSRTSFETPTLDFDPEDINNLPEGGMGLYIIHQLMDEIDYQIINDKNIFILKKYLD